MEFWIFLLAVWLVAEWLMRRSYQQRNDERFGNIVSGLNSVERELSELKKLAARVKALEQHPAEPAVGGQPATAVPTPSAAQPRTEAAIRGLEPTVAAQLPRPTPPIPPPVVPTPAMPAAPPPIAAPP